MDTSDIANKVSETLKSLPEEKHTAFLNLLLMTKEKTDDPEKVVILALNALKAATPDELEVLSSEDLL